MPIQAAIVNAVLFALIGALVFGFSFWLADRLTPFKLWDQILKEKNIALAIIMGCVAISLGMIVAAAIRG